MTMTIRTVCRVLSGILTTGSLETGYSTSSHDSFVLARQSGLTAIQERFCTEQSVRARQKVLG